MKIKVKAVGTTQKRHAGIKQKIQNRKKKKKIRNVNNNSILEVDLNTDEKN